jgi:hypothetical protein
LGAIAARCADFGHYPTDLTTTDPRKGRWQFCAKITYVCDSAVAASVNKILRRAKNSGIDDVDVDAGAVGHVSRLSAKGSLGLMYSLEAPVHKVRNGLGLT